MKRSILITGASSGIGRATALRFARNGDHVILVARRETELEELSSEIKKIGGTAECHPLDVNDESGVAKLFSNLNTLDVAVNNAAIEGAREDIQYLTLKDFDTVMNTDVRALFHFLQQEVTHFRSRRKPGAIINISSIAGLIGIPTSSLYCAAKHAVLGFTKSLAIEQAPHGIRINAICPGAVDTPMLRRIFNNDFRGLEARYPLGRIGRPEEIADAIFWLASKDSSFMVGHAMVLDGGATVV